jgi:hypothetical protein
MLVLANWCELEAMCKCQEGVQCIKFNIGYHENECPMLFGFMPQPDVVKDFNVHAHDCNVQKFWIPNASLPIVVIM